jgi:cell division protein FtsQ
MSSTRASSSRSDEIRRKRSSQPRKTSRPNPGKRAQKTSAPPPPKVLVRGALASSMAQERRGKKKNSKRRYDVALSTPGAEMRLPALPRFQLGWRLVSAALVIGLAYLLYSVWNSPTYRVLAAEVKGADRLTSLDINSVAGVAGKPIFMVEPEKVRQELRVAFPELSSVKVEMELPAKVTVIVEERQPVLAWVQDDQELWIDSSGVAFSPRGESGSLVLVKAHTPPPGISGGKAVEAAASEMEAAGVEALPGGAPPAGASETEAAEAFVPKELVNAILIMAEQAPEGTPLVFNNKHGLGWEDKRGWEVYFGATDEDMPMKLQVYKAIVKRLKKDEVRPEFISVEYVHAPYYRLDR